MLNLKLSYYNTYKEKSYSENETGAYALALQDEEEQEVYVEVEEIVEEDDFDVNDYLFDEDDEL